MDVGCGVNVNVGVMEPAGLLIFDGAVLVPEINGS